MNQSVCSLPQVPCLTYYISLKDTLSLFPTRPIARSALYKSLPPQFIDPLPPPLPRRLIGQVGSMRGKQAFRCQGLQIAHRGLGQGFQKAVDLLGS